MCVLDVCVWLVLGGGIPRLSRSTGSFVGGIRSEYDSFDIPRRERKLVYIDASDEQDDDDDDDDDNDRRYDRNDRYGDDDSYERRKSNSDEEYHQRPRPAKSETSLFLYYAGDASLTRTSSG